MILSVTVNILCALQAPDLLAVFCPRPHSIIPRFTSRPLGFAYFYVCFTSLVQSSLDFSNLDDDVIPLPSAQKEFRFSIACSLVGRDFVELALEAGGHLNGS